MKKDVLFVLLIFGFSFFQAYSESKNGDVNCDGSINIIDVTHTINYLYKDGEAPCEFPLSGIAYKEYSDSSQVLSFTSSNPWHKNWPTVDSLTIYCPDSGFVVFKGWAIDSLEIYETRLGLTTDPDLDPAFGDYSAIYMSGGYIKKQALEIEKIVKVDPPGNITVYLKATADPENGQFLIKKYKLSAVFYPIGY